MDRFLAPEAVGLRQVPFTVLYAITWLLTFLVPGGPVQAGAATWFGMWLGLLLVLAVQNAGVLIPWARVADTWQSVLPLAQMGALVALQDGSGAAVTAADALLVLPAATLGLRGSWSAVVLAVAAATGVQVATALAAPEAAVDLLVPRTVVMPLVALVVALGSAGVARLVRDRQAQPAGQTQYDLIAMLSHELRSPLTSVLGYAQLLDTDTLTPEQHRYVGVIERNGRRLLHLTDELMVSARFAAGQLDVHPRDVDLARVVRARAEELGPAVDAAGLTLTVTTPDTTTDLRTDPDAHPGTDPATVPGDPELLAQMVDTLVSHALRHTPRGGAVTLRVDVQDDHGPGGPRPPTGATDGPAGRRVLLEVSDTGTGLHPDELARLTTRPHGPDGAPRRPREIALGLPVAQAIVDAHGGTLDVQSTAGEGTRVTVTLPSSAPR
ncbi:sensor histidine kinase [Promicromonospora sp. MS192]|uniref:sensor histidine kinase n=1 Tax=Promicromonospora sp. MS192 TaxID=3412684 RepID=UPI003C2D94AF